MCHTMHREIWACRAAYVAVVNRNRSLLFSALTNSFGTVTRFCLIKLSQLCTKPPPVIEPGAMRT